MEGTENYQQDFNTVMNSLKTILLIGCLLLGEMGFTQYGDFQGNPDDAFKVAQQLAFSGHRGEAKDTLSHILTTYPLYTDVRNLLAKIHSWEGQYDQARREFNKITSSEKSNKEVWVAAINNELYAKNYATALGLSNKALIHLEPNTEIDALRNQALDGLGMEFGKGKRKEVPKQKDSVDVSRTASKNQIGVYGTLEVFDKVFDPMTAVSLEYKRTEKWGAILTRVNYANRFNTNGLQYEVDLYPKLSKTLYAYFNYGYSATDIFPDHRAGGELYAKLPKGFETSAGFRYLKFDAVDAKIITGSLGLYKGNYYFSLRPFITLPETSNPTGFAVNILARKYLTSKYHFYGLNIAAGIAPELRQLRSPSTLLSETLLHLESQQLGLEYQFINRKNNGVYKLNLGATRQELAFEPGSFFYAIAIGGVYQLGF